MWKMNLENQTKENKMFYRILMKKKKNKKILNSILNANMELKMILD
jgi:hypothetical protein